MKPEEKNNHYHYILSILRKKEYSEQDMAKDIILYFESVMNQQKMDLEEQEELYGGEGRPNLPLPRFGKMFKRVT